MADEKQPGKAQEFFSKHGEKLALAIAVVALLAYAGIMTTSSGDPTASQLDGLTGQVNAEAKKLHDKPEVLQEPYKNCSAEATDPWNRISRNVAAGNDWTMSVLPRVKLTGTEPIVVAAKSVVMAAIDLKVDAGLDGVVLTWTIKAYTDDEKKKYDIAEIKEYRVERKDAENGAWKEINKVDAKTLTYLDKQTNLKPKSNYWYRVKGVSDHNKFKETHGGGVGDPSNAVAAATLGIWRLTFMNPLAGTDDKPGQAYVELEKYDPDHGKVKISHIYHVGDTLGVFSEKEGEAPTGMHKMIIGGKEVSVNFDSKSLLKKIGDRRFKDIPRRVCKVEHTDKGTVKPHEPEKVTVKLFTALEIIYTDPDDPNHEISILKPDPKDVPYLQDDLCPDHGGKKKTETEPTKDPVKDAEKEARAKKEKEADKLYTEAEQLAKDPKKKADAKAKYQKILTDFADTDFVKKKRKDIEAAIKKLG